MKRSFKILTALLLVMSMALSFAACGSEKPAAEGSGNSGSGDSAEHPEYVFHADFDEIVKESDVILYPRVYTDDGFYSTTYVKVGEDIPEGATPEYEGQYDVYETKLYYVGFDGKYGELSNFKQIAGVEETPDMKDYRSNNNVEGIAVGSDGNIVTIESVYSSWYDGPEGLDREKDPEYWDYQQFKNEYYIRSLDDSGNELSCAKIDLGEDEYLNAYTMQLASDNDIALSDDTGIRFIGLDGKQLGHIDSSDYVQSLIKMDDGRLAVTFWGEDGCELAYVDEKNMSLSQPVKLPGDPYNMTVGGGKYDAYYTNGVNFYGFNFDSGESTKLFNWINCDVNTDELGQVKVTDDGSVLCVTSTTNKGNKAHDIPQSYDISLVTVKNVPYDSVPHKESISLATQYLSWSIKDKIIDFNRKNDSCHIDIKDYSEFNTEEDYNAGSTKLLTEIMAGNVPDIIDLNGMPYQQLAAKGLLADLYPYIDADPDFGREDFFENILGGLEVDGKLCSTVSGFNINSVIGAASVVGDEPGWTYDEFDEALASMPEGCDPFDVYTTRDDILTSCLALDLDNYVDWSTGQCGFDSEGFVKLLEFANRFPAEFDWDGYEWSEEDSHQNRIAQGRQMLMMSGIYSFEDIFYNDIYFGGDSTYIGYPTFDGRPGNTIGVFNQYAISSQSDHKDEAWSFLRQLFSEDGQMEYGLPVNKNAFNDKLQEAMTPEYEKDADGNYVLDENGEKIEISRGGMAAVGTSAGGVVEFYAVTQEQADELMDVITSTTNVGSYNESIFDIVKEQAQAFFEGQKSAQEVAKLIQSKVNIYVNEQR
ncbi:MAG: ABC transporter substrate-binding protein [Candidatus Limivicinus sp.]|jgi:ABC-type glycerol-3-phosphate transport system substrate-binding protein